MNILKIHILSPFFDTPACGDRGHTIAIGQPGAGKTAFFSDLMADIVKRQPGLCLVAGPGMSSLTVQLHQSMLQQGGSVFVYDPAAPFYGPRKPSRHRTVSKSRGSAPRSAQR